MCDDDSSVDYEQPDEEERVLESNFIHDSKGYRQQGRNKNKHAVYRTIDCIFHRSPPALFRCIAI